VWVDDVEMDEDGLADMLLDENATAAMPRPGTSLNRPMTGAAGGGISAGERRARPSAPARPPPFRLLPLGRAHASHPHGPARVPRARRRTGMRPTTQSGRPLTGFARPGTGLLRPGTQAANGRGASSAGLAAAMAAGRPGTSTARPMTSFGRLVRLGTASLAASGAAGGAGGGPFIDVERLDLRRYAAKPALARALFEYILYVEHSVKRALELAALATAAASFGDWWWKERLGKCYFKLGALAARGGVGGEGGAGSVGARAGRGGGGSLWWRGERRCARALADWAWGEAAIVE
jgi:tetratricopeptide repeat protein 8